jgi:Amt family ammonium transporter
MVKSINEVAHALGIATIAKRVDDPAVMKALEQLGVDYAQGYSVAMPARIEH